eukprot:s6229_g10.t1
MSYKLTVTGKELESVLKHDKTRDIQRIGHSANVVKGTGGKLTVTGKELESVLKQDFNCDTSLPTLLPRVDVNRDIQRMSSKELAES